MVGRHCSHPGIGLQHRWEEVNFLRMKLSGGDSRHCLMSQRALPWLERSRKFRFFFSLVLVIYYTLGACGEIATLGMRLPFQAQVHSRCPPGYYVCSREISRQVGWKARREKLNQGGWKWGLTQCLQMAFEATSVSTPDEAAQTRRGERWIGHFGECDPVAVFTSAAASSSLLV